MEEENKIPQLEALEEGAEAESTHKDFDKWHDGHMERVKEGLEKIIASNSCCFLICSADILGYILCNSSASIWLKNCTILSGYFCIKLSM